MHTTKQCGPEDIALLRQLAIKTFVDTYSAHNTPEVMADYLEKAFHEAQLVRELSHPESEFHVIEEAGQWIAYIKLNEGTAQTDDRSDSVLEIERIYVDQDYQGNGFGKILLEIAVAVARTKRKGKLWLGVWEQNPKAISFYESQGFTKTGTHVFMIGGEAQNDWVMEKEV